MMLPTHVLAGMVLALPVALAVPEFAAVALLGGLVGGGVPDLDMYVGHRRTLHFPVYYSVLAVAGVGLAALVPTAGTVGLATLLAGAALHCVADVFGGGLELKPWEGTSNRAVYDHYRGQWIMPRRWIGYDGSPRDLVLSVGLGLPLLLFVQGPFWWVVGGLILIATVYTVLRRHLAALAPTVAAVVPERAEDYVPPRYR